MKWSDFSEPFYSSHISYILRAVLQTWLRLMSESWDSDGSDFASLPAGPAVAQPAVVAATREKRVLVSGNLLERTPGLQKRELRTNVGSSQPLSNLGSSWPQFFGLGAFFEL